MISLNTITFDCDRTCPNYGELSCRFNPLLRAIGATANSHTVKVKVNYSDPETLRCAVQAMGGLWYGMAEHDLYDTKQTGYGFRLPMANGRHRVGDQTYWYHPIVLRADGELAYDDYGGSWGDKSQLERLKAEYAFTSTEVAARNLGWQTERTDLGLCVYHPQGGVLTVSKEGICETTGFTGSGCHEARESLGLKTDGQIINKPEYAQQKQQCHLPG